MLDTDETSDGRFLGEHLDPPKPMPRMEAKKHLALRKLKERLSINDLIEQVYVSLVEDQEFLAYLDAVGDEQAVEGSMSADNFKACEVIRERAAIADPNSPVARLKLATINRALGVVLRRYGLSRKERRYSLHGETVPPDGNNDTE